MWTHVSELTGVIAFIILLNILWLAFDVPEWLEKVLKKRGNKSRMEARIATLEKRILEIEQRMSRSN